MKVKYSDFSAITWLVCLSQYCLTELQLLLSRPALTDSCSYYFIRFQSSTYYYVQCHGRASKGSLILPSLWKGRFCARCATHFEYKGKFAIIQIEESRNNIFQELRKLRYSLYMRFVFFKEEGKNYNNFFFFFFNWIMWLSVHLIPE